MRRYILKMFKLIITTILLFSFCCIPSYAERGSGREPVQENTNKNDI